MSRERKRFDRVVSTLNRRQAIAGGAALLTAGRTLVVVGEPSSAAVSVENFSVADQQFTRESVTPVVDVTIAYTYDVGNSAVGDLYFEVLVGGDVVASDDLVTDATTLDGETTLSGPVTESGAWSSSDFEPTVADSVSRDLEVTVRFAVRDSSGGDIVSDSATDTATVTVSHPQETTYTVAVGGSGTIRAQSE